MLLNVYQNKTFYRVWTPVSAYAHRNLLTLINCLLERHNVFNTWTLCMRRNNIQTSQYILNSGFYILPLLSFCSYGIFFLSNSRHIPVFLCLICKYLIVVDNPKIKSRDLFGFFCVYIFAESEIIGTRYLCDAIDYNCLTISTHK